MNHETRAKARKDRKTANAQDRRTAAAYLAARPVRVTEEYCIGGADEPYHVSMVEAARRLKFEGQDFRPDGSNLNVWLDEDGVWRKGGDVLAPAAFYREALKWLRDGGGSINVTLPGCLPSYIRFSLGADKGDLRRTQQWVKRCRLTGRPVSV